VTFEPTSEQKRILELGSTSYKSIMIDAYAGCAKTTTLTLLAQRLPNRKSLAIAFNVKIKKELELRFPDFFTVMTMNGLGHRAWCKAINNWKLNVDDKKIGKIVTEEIKKAGVNSQKAHDRAVKAAAARWEKENASSNAPSIANALLEECPSPSPSPSPSPIETPTASPATQPGKSKDLSPPPASTKKGTALPADWVLPKAWGDWALSEKPELQADDVRRMADTFRDHWVANSNRAIGKKADWLATWRNWVRNSKPAHGGQFMTASQRRMAVTDKAIDEWLNEDGPKDSTIEGEFQHV